MDFFAAGIILCIQRQRAGAVALLLLVGILVQEGTGPLAFGTSILRYGVLVGFYLAGQRLFDEHSMAFALLVGAVFSITHYVSLKTMVALQDWVVLDLRILLECFLLFFVFLLEWALLSRIHRVVFPHAPRP